MSRLKICFVSFQYPPIFTGGAATYAKFLCNELANLGHDVHVISSTYQRKSEIISQNHVMIHKIPVSRIPHFKIPSYLLRTRDYFRVLNNALGEFDVLHGNVTADICLTKGFVNLPRVVTVHHLGRMTLEIMRPSLLDMIMNLTGEIGLVSWIEKKLIDFDKVVARRANKIVAVSNFVNRSLVQTFGIPPHKIITIYNGVNINDYECSESLVTGMRDRIGSDTCIMLVGRLEARKGIHNLLRAFKLVSDRRKCKLIIVGSGNQKPYKRICSSIGIDKKTIFMGFVDFKTLKLLYNACDILVQPSIFEGLGMTILEAMACGKPIVASKVGGIPEIVKNSVNGILVKPTDIEELAKALIFLIDNPKLAKRIGEENKKFVRERFSWKRTAINTERLYESIIV